MPEEINRLLTDQISDLLFTPSDDAGRNLTREGIPSERIHLVGNVMIDTLVRLLPYARLPELDLPSRYILVTLHRPSNVDDVAGLEKLLAVLIEISEHTPVLFPVHPRTAKALNEHGVDRRGSRLYLLDPQPYLQFLALQQRAELVVTDSGGIQEETTFLGIPCLTVRDNTERPITVTCGTNIVVGRDASRLREHALRILGGEKKKGTVPPLWDGHAAERIAAFLVPRGSTASADFMENVKDLPTQERGDS
jgi:UDP-N-acetylglucosamine 2-epimerase (non-hydrolysing)